MRVTVEEIAKLAGVSKATVSRVLNNAATGVSTDTRRKVQEIIEKMNYSHEYSVANMRSKSIALIVPDITNPFFADIARSIERRAIDDNFIVILANTDFSEKTEREYISNLIAKKVDGIVIVPSGSRAFEEHLAPGRYGIPMVMLDRKLDGMDDCPGVYSDNEFASFRCCEMLINNGSRDIAFISGEMGVFTAIERLNGYKAALSQYGIPFDENKIKMGNYTLESGYNAVVELEKAGVRYSAVLAANDMMALGALKALREFSYKVPEEMEIVGFDNIIFSQYWEPSLSTIQQPTTEMGWRAADMLLRMIAGEKVTDIVRLQPKLVLRQTTK